MSNHLDYDEESLNEKAKKGAGFFVLVGSGALSIIHTLSHIVPAVGILGLSLGAEDGFFYSIVASEYMQIAYVPFVVLSFWYMYRDHKHHQHERELRLENEMLRRLIRKKSNQK